MSNLTPIQHNLVEIQSSLAALALFCQKIEKHLEIAPTKAGIARALNPLRPSKGCVFVEFMSVSELKNLLGYDIEKFLDKSRCSFRYINREYHYALEDVTKSFKEYLSNLLQSS